VICVVLRVQDDNERCEKKMAGRPFWGCREMVNRQQQHNIRARRRLASQWQSSLTIAHRGLKEYITSDPQRELEVRR
jgi:hypothetical protein